MNLYINETHDEERAFYGVSNAVLQSCAFEGPADGESALKETHDLGITGCRFSLRYPLWHTENTFINSCEMFETCRAALWYDKNVIINDTVLGGIKALRECEGVTLNSCNINSSEFGWFCRGLDVNDCRLVSEYPFLKSCDMKFDKLHMQAKYSFQYVSNVIIRNSVLDTKDAFWHSDGVTVYDSVVNGEYLGWYSKNLHLIRCKIKGTQPLCYAEGLVLEDCEMTDCDLSFERSDVRAAVSGEIMSVKNPLSGKITADRIGEIIMDLPESKCVIEVSAK